MNIQIKFGLGEIVVSTGTYGGEPAVFLSEAKFPGEIGQPCPLEDISQDSIPDGSVIMTFPTMEQAKMVANGLMNKKQEKL